MLTRYSLKAEIRAILGNADGKLISVGIPAGVILTRHWQASEESATLLGLVGVDWEGRQYSVLLKDLLQKAEFVDSA
jgi:hypothetical protein